MGDVRFTRAALCLFLASSFAFSLQSVFEFNFKKQVPIVEISKFTELENKAEVEIEKFSGSQKNSLLKNLAVKYAEAHYIQEAIWTLHWATEHKEAQELTQRLENFLETAEISNLERHYRETNFIITFKNGIKGYFKMDPDWQDYKREIFAYEFDKYLGLNVIPVTVMREINGQKGSLQYFITKVESNSVYIEERARITLLDFLLGNSDRHEANWLKRAGDHAVAIDHGLIFQTEHLHYDDALLDSKILQKLWDLTEANMQQKFGHLIRGENIRSILKQRDTFFKDLGIESLTHTPANGITKEAFEALLEKNDRAQILKILTDPTLYQWLVPKFAKSKSLSAFVTKNIDSLSRNFFRFYIAVQQSIKSTPEVNTVIQSCRQVLLGANIGHGR